MRGARAVVVTCAVLLAGVSLAWRLGAQEPRRSATDQRPHFRTAVRLTTVNVTMTDANGRLVRDLARDRFEVYEDGQPQVVTQFTSDRVPVKSFTVTVPVAPSR